MISYVDNNNLSMLEEFLSGQNNIYSCRISCLLKSYGLGYDFAGFHIQTDEAGNVTAAFGKYYSDMTVCLTESSDIDELSEFLSVCGFSSLLCGAVLPIGGSFDSGMIMELKKPVPQKALPDGMRFDTAPPLRDVWTLLKSCEGRDFEVPEYEDFLIDMSHKLRHGTARCIAVQSGQEITASSMTVSESDDCAIIGAVASQKAHRRIGIGSACVTRLCSELRNRTVFIMRDENKNESFYNSLGFENRERFYIYKGKGKII